MTAVQSLIAVALTVIALLLWFVWRQLEQIAQSLHKLYTEAKRRRVT